MNPEKNNAAPVSQAETHLDQAFVYYEETEEFDKALVECDTAIELDPDLADAHNLRGVLLEELGRNAEAIQAYQQALVLDPDFSEAKDNIAELQAEGVNNGRLVTIASYSYPTEAYIVKGRLESEGIWSYVADAETVTVNWLYSNAIGGVKLRVREADRKKAQEILAHEAEAIEWDDEEYEDEEYEEEVCPICKSQNTDYEKYAMKLVFLSWLILSVPLPFLKRKWKCQDCGHTWKTKKTP
ncbi:MAG: tetratricopeptide repeat protein [Deltaproteobacteria bacterium]|nr:tetratricopeptide repeat protein [Deltaproteobacteria bacterium]